MENPYAIIVVDSTLLNLIQEKLDEFPHFMGGNLDISEYLNYFNTLSDTEYFTHIGDAVRFTCMLHHCTCSAEFFQQVDKLLGELTSRLQLHILYGHHNIGGSYQDHIDMNDLRSIAVDMAISAMPTHETKINSDTINHQLGMACIKFMRSNIFKH